jgi:anti-sigma regulatory factor (Ser/Thr protein kinase)
VAEQAVVTRSVRLAPIPTSAGAARSFVREAFAEVGETAALFAAELAVSELVTNAILHAATAVELTVRITDEDVTVSVHDGHPRLPTQRESSRNATTGRGLVLVASVSDAYGVELEPPEGKSVWFRVLRGIDTLAAPAPPSLVRKAGDEEDA